MNAGGDPKKHPKAVVLLELSASAGRRPALLPRPRRRPPGHQAAEPPPQRRRQPQGLRLRPLRAPRQAPRRRAPPHGLRHPGLHGAGGRLPEGLRRRQGRRVVVRCHPFRPPRGIAAVRRRQSRPNYRAIYKRAYAFPKGMSGSARRLVARLLDPNPETRMTIGDLADHPWLKRSLSLDSSLTESAQPDDALAPRAMNAFDIIALSSALDLSGLFDDDRKKREKRFTSTAPVERIMRRMEEMGMKLGFSVERRNGCGVGMGRWGSVVLVVEVVEVATSLLLVELKVEDGSGGDGEGFGWEELRAGLGDIVSAWQD